MSHAGPPEPPQPDPEQPPSGATEPPGEQPWSPYPTGWDQPSQSTATPPPTYGAPQSPYQPGSYEQSAYGVPGQPTQPNPYAGAPRPDRPVFGFGGYASWSTRVGAYLIDYVAGLVAAVPLYLGFFVLASNTTTITNPDGTTTSTYNGSQALPILLLVIGGVTSLAFFVWNVCIRQGRTGATIGKSVLAIRLVNSDQQPIGPGWAFLRYILNIVNALPCYLGYFWPIWDSHKQTFADKIMTTYVIHATERQPRPY